MNEQNAEYLKERLFYLGFAEKLNAQLEKHMKEGTEKFQIPFTAEFPKGDKKIVVEYSLDFSKSKKEDKFFINKYQATLKDEDPSKEKTQTFYINKGNGVAAKEAFNMLEGRAVYKKLFDKDGDPYHRWEQLNFNQKDTYGNHIVQTYHEKYGFNVEKALSRHPIKELGDPIRKGELIKSLEKGNRPQVTVRIDEKEHKMFLEASPSDRRVNVFDETGQKQFQGVREHKPSKDHKQSSGQEQSNGKDKSQKKENPDESDAPQKSKRKGISV
jgi:DNA-dependent RNA polymerase auxiliary subunit epsilon